MTVPPEWSKGPSGGGPYPSYDLETLMRHVPQSVTAIRRVTREMRERGITETWRLAGLLAAGVFVGVESVAREAFSPDPWFDAWRSGLGVPLFNLALFLGSVVAEVAVAYVVAAWLWLVLRAFREGAAFADVRTAIVSSGMPMAAVSATVIALCGAALLVGASPDGAIASLLNAIDLVAVFLSIGYLAAAMSEATGLPAMRLVALQFLAGLMLVLAVVGVTALLGLVI